MVIEDKMRRNVIDQQTCIYRSSASFGSNILETMCKYCSLHSFKAVFKL